MNANLGPGSKLHTAGVICRVSRPGLLGPSATVDGKHHSLARHVLLGLNGYID